MGGKYRGVSLKFKDSICLSYHSQKTKVKDNSGSKSSHIWH